MYLATYVAEVLKRIEDIANLKDDTGPFIGKVIVEDDSGTWILQDRDGTNYWTLRPWEEGEQK